MAHLSTQALQPSAPVLPEIVLEGYMVNVLCSVQVGSGDMDGFQADTEEDEDDTDCMIIDVPDVVDDVSEAPIPAPTLCK